MSRALKKRELYEKYSGICLTEAEYTTLEEDGIIPKKLGEVFHGSFHNGLSMDKAFLNGTVIGHLCSTGAKMVLESWDENDEFRDDHTAAFVFRDFVVIVPEPSIKPGQHADPFYKIPDVLPVAIPLCCIKELSSEKTLFDYEMVIVFSDGSKYIAKNGRNGNYRPEYIYATNFAFNVNERLLNGISRKPINADKNQKIIEEALMKFAKEAKHDWDDRRNAIMAMFKDPSSIFVIEKKVYSSDVSFVQTVAKNADKLCKEVPENLIKLLTNIKDEINYKEKQIEEKESQIQELNEKIQGKNEELLSAGFFKKGGIKKEIASLEEEIRLKKAEEQELKTPGDNYKEAYQAILNEATGRLGSIDKYSDEEFSLAKQVYELCAQRKVTQVRTEDEKLIFTMICDQLGVPEKLRNEEFLVLGAPVAKKERKGNGLSDELKKKRVKKQILYGEEKDKTQIVGVMKYIAGSIEGQKKAQGEAAAQAFLAKAFTPLKPVTHDSAIVGGLVSGLAGPVAGVAAAVSNESKNAAAKASYAEAVAKNNEYKANAYAKQRQYLGTARSYGSTIERIQSKLCDENNTSKYFSYLDCYVKKYSIEEEGSMTISVVTKLVKEPKIGDMNVAIDGSLHILIEENNKMVGDGYLCADGFNTTKLSKVGFKDNRGYTVIGLPLYAEFSAEKKYKFKIEPIRMWAIEI